MKTIHLVDTTLNDQNQTSGATFSLKEKVMIARMLDFLGVEIIEAGVPSRNEKELAAVSVINSLGLRARITTWNSLNIGDIRASLNCGVRDIHVSAPVSGMLIGCKTGGAGQWILDNTKRVMRYAGEYGCRISVGAEDASRAEWVLLEEFALLAQEMGAERFRFVDSMGIMEPMEVLEKLSRLREKLSIDIEFQGHNNTDTAVTNAVVAVKAGARYITTSVKGRSRWAAGTDLKKLILALKISGFSPNLRFNMINKLERYVTTAVGGFLPEKNISIGTIKQGGNTYGL